MTDQDEIDGRVITGATIRTSTGLPRREISNDGMFHIDRQGGKWKYIGSIYDEGSNQ